MENTQQPDHYYWMEQALKLAEQAAQQQEVPVGALVVHNQKCIGEGFNQPIQLHDASAHAEVCAIRQACQHIQNYRLIGATLYTTLEPCTMCAGAILNARISHVVYGADDFRAGAIHSIFNVFDEPQLTHKVSYQGGVLADVSAQLLRDFFRARRGVK